MAVISNLAVKLTLAAQGVEKGLKAAGDKTAQFATQFAGAAKVGGAVALTALAAAGTALVKLTTDAFKTIPAIAKLSDQFDVSTESIVAMQTAAKRLGIGQDDLTKGLQSFNARLGEV